MEDEGEHRIHEASHGGYMELQEACYGGRRRIEDTGGS